MKRPLDDKMMISGQIMPADVPGLAEQGIALIINNRPDGEEPGQPLAAEIEAAAQQAGVAYRYIPIVRGIGPSDVEDMREAINSCEGGKILAFCRSGTRSTLAWAVARAKDGASFEELERSANGAGVDIGPIAHLL